MSLYNRILVPLDGTATDDAVLAHVGELAAANNADVVLLRVAHYHTRDSRTHEVEDCRADLERSAAQLRGRGFEVSTVLGDGEPADVIVAQAADLGADLIAMATHGHNWLSRFVFGSVAEAVRHRSAVPLLLLKGGPAEGGAGRHAAGV